MPTTVDRTKLLNGPYIPPQVHRGDVLFDERDGLIKTGGYTSAPISWPRRLKTGKHSPILCGDLVKAVRIESELAVAHHWGVSVTTVWAWRRALGVGQITEGTNRLYREYKPLKLTEERTAKGRERCGTVEHRKASRKRLLGKAAHPATAAALRKSAKRRKLKSHREKIGATQHRNLLIAWRANRPADWPQRERAAIRALQCAPPPSRTRRWLAEEVELLGQAPDSIVANLLGRSKASIALARQSRGLPAWGGSE